MALTGYIKNLFIDKEKTIPLFPRTNVKAVIDDDGNTLDDLLIYSGDEDVEAAVDVRDADTLGGVSAANFVQKNELNPKAGFIYPLATDTIPGGFLLCDGKAYDREEYQELFAAIGTYYGEGDGSTTFNVPNLQTRVPVGAGDGYELGSIGGEATHTLTVDEMPSHYHMITTRTQAGSHQGYATTTGNTTSTIGNINTQSAGGGASHNNMQPYTVINYIISTGKDTGVYVSDIIAGVQAIPLEIQYGGTGATNADDARKNLGVREYKQNLLDNSDFTNPVNQRGQSNYSVAQGGYTIDRWMPLNASTVQNTAVLSDDGVTFGNANNEQVYLTQRFEKGYLDSGKTYTFVCCHSDGVKSFDGYIDYSNDGMDIVNITFPANSTIKWAALYEGEYTAETLPPYVPKGYSAELLECQRYYIQFGQYITLAGYRSTSNYGFIFLPTEMRATPTTTFTTDNSSAYVVDGGNSSITEITSVTQKGNSVRLTYTTSGTLTNYRPINANFRNLKMSADL